ncbi:VOC family protein [Halorarum salinum]|uniref:VOC family protein n=1 Tax=Halorarum salinum TaxID=2743089 RepID=A0A7D5QBK1_9EURY|nr:VOC family protein [Halobaculum salinum]QLG62299.1 VOC family protein [Halobaculum salinum]
MDIESSSTLTFTHTRLLVTGYQECFRFYRDVLGFEVGWGDEESYYADFEAGDATLALFGREAMADAVGVTEKRSETPRQDEVALIFRVESVNETYQELREKIEFVTEPHDRPDWGIRVAHFRDPDENLIEINRSLEA